MRLPAALETRIQFGRGNSRDEIIKRHLAKTATPEFRDTYRSTFDRAQAYIAEQTAQGKKGFVVFDIDETALDNRGFFADPRHRYFKRGNDIASIKEGWNAWITRRTAIPAIPEAKKLIDWLNQQQIPYLFLTGISATLRDASIRKLKQANLWGQSCLGAFYRTKEFSFPGATDTFKRSARPQLEARFGMPIMASIGDHPRDMTGDPARDFLLPDYVKGLRSELETAE